MQRLPQLVLVWLPALAFILLETSTACPAPCTCWWKSGKEMVRCSGVSSMPTELASTTQVLDLSGNALNVLPEEFFLRANLLHLQRIYLAHCRLIAIHNAAFARLANLVELDLSDNKLQSVPSQTFIHFPDLRRLSLSGNPLVTLLANAFAHLTDLTTLELSHCHLETVSDSAFVGLRSLTQLKLEGNLLQRLNGEVVAPLVSLHAVLLHDNPWCCDCRLRALHRWLVARRLHQSAPPSLCTSPMHVQNQALDELKEQLLACPPQGPYIHRRVKALNGDDAVLLCKVTSDPEARIQWQWKGHPITNLSYAHHSGQPYLIQESGTVNKTSALRIAGVSEEHAGQYQCFARNIAGSFAQTLSLHVVERAGAEAEVHVGQVVGIFLAVMATTMSLVVLCLLFVKRRPVRTKYLKYLSVNTLRQSLPFARNRRFEQGDSPEMQALKKTSHNGKRPLSPDAMSFLVNDFGVPQSPYHLSCVQNNRPDVVHVQEPVRQGNQCNDTSLDTECCSHNNDSSVEDGVHSNNCTVAQIGEKSEENPVCASDSTRKEARYREDVKDSKNSIDADLIDKLKWSESFSSRHDLPEEIEMKVHLDHLSAESTWKQSNISLTKFTSGANSEWFSEEHDSYHRSPKHYPETSWWESHQLPVDNSYNFCMYEKSPLQAEEDLSVLGASNNNHSASKLQCTSPLDPTPETSTSPNLFLPSFTDFLYESPETDL